MNVTNDKHQKKTSERILEAAEKLFSELGYAGVSINDVAVEANVNKASVFYHYGNKEALFETVLKSYCELQLETLQQASETDGSSQDHLHRVMDAYFDFVLEHRNFATMLAGMLSNTERAELVHRALGETLAWLQQSFAELVPARGPGSWSQTLFTLMGASLTWITFLPVINIGDTKPASSVEGGEERRAHIHWLIDLLIENANVEANPQ